MAAKEGVPPDKLEKKTCSKEKVAAVVCLICHKLYHGPCYSAVSEKIFISNSLVICPVTMFEIRGRTSTRTFLFGAKRRTVVSNVQKVIKIVVSLFKSEKL